MSGKGSGRRPQQVSEDEAAANWARIFGKREPANKESGEIKCAEESAPAPADRPGQ
ncbi:hypothetical protein [Stutzerimonas kunmingensis]|uniref:hypothetical protein n=1 Tax=Stutzerimonas kunmingensis TaxID=1211807 RepID=UPI002FCB28A0